MLHSDLTGYTVNIHFYISVISTESCTCDGHQCATMDTALLRVHNMDIYKIIINMWNARFSLSQKCVPTWV